MTSPSILRRLLHAALVVAIGAGCLVGGFRVVAGCWLGRDCGLVSEPIPVPQPVLLSRDELTVTMQTTRPCNGSLRLTATEQSDHVVLSSVETWSRAAPTCNAAMALGWWTVHLRAPLGDRSLTDATTGQPIRWVGGRHRLEPSFLPMTYAHDGVRIGQLDGTDPSKADMCYIRYFYSDRAYLTVADCPPDTPGSQAGPTGPNVHADADAQVPVRAATARVWLGSDTPNALPAWRQVVWSEGGQVYAVTGTGATGSPEPVSTLVAVANGLR